MEKRDEKIEKDNKKLKLDKVSGGQAVNVYLEKEIPDWMRDD